MSATHHHRSPGTVLFISSLKPRDWAMKQTVIIITQHHFSPDKHPLNLLLWAVWRNTVSQQDLSQMFHLLGIWYERKCRFTLVKSTLSMFCFTLSRQVNVIVLGGLKSAFCGWLMLAGNEAKLRSRWCAYWFTTLLLFLCLFVCLLAFFTGLGSQYSHICIWHVLRFIHSLERKKRKIQCFDICWHPPLLNIKAPGFLNKLICGHSRVISHWYVCVCAFLVLWISRAQRCARLWQSAAAPLLPWKWGTRVCAHSTHTYK